MVGLTNNEIIFTTIAVLVVALIAFLWVTGIAYMKEVHGEYKGEDFLDEEKSEGYLATRHKAKEWPLPEKNSEKNL